MLQNYLFGGDKLTSFLSRLKADLTEITVFTPRGLPFLPSCVQLILQLYS